jgi:hypothetical protein
VDLRRLRAGEWIVGAAGVIALVALFIPWYEGDVSGWEALTITDVLLALLALGAIALVFVTAAQRTAAVPIAYEGILTLAALAIFAAVAFRVANPPGDLDRAGGAFLGLLAAFSILAGSLVAMRDERRSKPGRPTDSAGAPAPPPEIETLPAPPRDASA